jgi:alpha-1,2-mannosyltransferase
VTNSRPQNRVLLWLVKVLAINFVLSAAIFLGLTIASGPTTDTIRRALKATAPAQVLRLRDRGGIDSWRPMLTAYQRKLEDPKSDLYATFFVERLVFQYPPSSLLLFDLFPRSMINLADLTRLVEPLKGWLDKLSRIAIGLTVLASVLILERGLRRLTPDRPAPPAQVAASVAISLAVGLTFYPVLVGYPVGQMQVFLNALLALAVLFSVIGRPALAGMCFGACCLVKPQYGLVLLWSLLRRQWRFTLGLVGVLVPGLAISIARFGLADHLRYLDVVRDLSRRGETLWFNQSVNGLLNRLLENGTVLMPSEAPPYHPVVYALTVLSSVAILALALWPRRDAPRPNGGVIDLMIMLVAITLASPIAWIHHYGAFLPVFAAAVPGLFYARPLGRTTVPLLALSYVAMANLLVWPEVVFRNRWVGLAGSHLFFGSLTFFGLLLALRAARWDVQESAERL